MKDKILLHICCAVDFIKAIWHLKDKYEITGFFYNPNIHPLTEYKVRLNDVLKVSELFKIEVIEGEYNPDLWIEKFEKYSHELEKGERCKECIKERIEKTLKLAEKLNIDKITSTLLSSPQKDFNMIKDIFKMNFKKFVFKNLRDIDINFLKEVENKLKIYRQDYCGCIYSLNQRYGQKLINLYRDKLLEKFEENFKGFVIVKVGGILKVNDEVIYEETYASPKSSFKGTLKRLFSEKFKIKIKNLERLEDIKEGNEYTITYLVKEFDGEKPSKTGSKIPFKIKKLLKNMLNIV